MSIKYNGKTIAGKYKAQIVTDASETDKGLIRVATDTEVTTGVDNTTVITPRKLKNQLDKKQNVLTAGTGIKIENNTISNTQTSAEWGNIQGDITSQTDLQNALNAKASTTSVTNLETEVTDLSGRVTANEADIMLKANKTDLPTIATTSKTGLIKPDGKTIKVKDDGTISSNTGIDLCTILCMPFGVDESENKYRYLNGQTIVQSQYPAFTAKVKSWQSTRASLFTTETNWQAIKTASKLGQCGKFVIDDTAGTIRLPLVINIDGLTDLSKTGAVKNESLPNIKANTDFWTYGVGTNNPLGAFYLIKEAENYTPNNGGNPSQLLGFDASRSSSTYQDNAPVQQEAVQYPYVICVNTEVEEAERPINNYLINNVYSHGVSQYYKGEMNNLSWLKSEGQWNPAGAYPSMYNWILENVNNGVEGFKRSTETYTDYDYVINTTDETFRLPLKNHSADDGNSILTLYYYVGETVQNVDLINAGRIAEELVTKADLDLSNLSDFGKIMCAKNAFAQIHYDPNDFSKIGAYWAVQNLTSGSVNFPDGGFWLTFVYKYNANTEAGLINSVFELGIVPGGKKFTVEGNYPHYYFYGIRIQEA